MITKILTHKKLWDTFKVVMKEKFITLIPVSVKNKRMKGHMGSTVG